MRNAARLWTALVIAVLLPACARAEAKVGAPAPDFTLTDHAGKQHRLADYRGKVVILEWINPNCPFSLRHSEEGTMTRLAKDNPDAVWLAINSTAEGHRDFLTPAEHGTFNAKHGITYPVLYDTQGATGHAYAARTTPHMFVIDEQGRVVYDGAIDDDSYGRKDARENYVEGALAAQRAGQPVDPSVTTPYGCSVKYAG